MAGCAFVVGRQCVRVQQEWRVAVSFPPFPFIGMLAFALWGAVALTANRHKVASTASQIAELVPRIAAGAKLAYQDRPGAHSRHTVGTSSRAQGGSGKYAFDVVPSPRFTRNGTRLGHSSCITSGSITALWLYVVNAKRLRVNSYFMRGPFRPSIVLCIAVICTAST